MKKSIEKQLKRFLKRKMCITEGVIVVFLITGAIGLASTVTISEDYLSTFYVESGQTEVIINPEVLVEESNGNAIEINGIENKVDIINHGTISGTNYFYDISPSYVLLDGNGIMADSSALGTVSNMGYITGEVTVENLTATNNAYSALGNGVYVITFSTETAIEHLINTGIISGTITFDNTIIDALNTLGNGIVGYSQNGNGIEKVTNMGKISGETTFINTDENDFSGDVYLNANGIVAWSNGNTSSNALDDVHNFGEISGKAIIDNIFEVHHTGNGIFTYSYGGLAIKYLYNDGIIKGYAEIENEFEDTDFEIRQVANGMSSGKGDILEVENEGIIVGDSEIETHNTTIIWTANGIASANNSIGTIKNVGIIKGSLNVSGLDNFIYNSGNGIYAGENITAVENKGLISGYFDLENSFLQLTSVRGVGNGIMTKVGSIDEIINYGTIEGDASVSNEIQLENSGNGIYSEEDIKEIENFGRIIGKTRAVGSDSWFNIENMGNGIYAGTEIGALENTGIISGTTTYINGDGLVYNSGNGIYATSEIESIDNNGIIKGYSSVMTDFSAQIRRVGNGIMIEGGVLSSISNSGTVEGYLTSNVVDIFSVGNGICIEGDLDFLENNGIIRGFEDGAFYQSAYGIWVAGSLGQVINNGVIASNGAAITANNFQENVFNKGIIISQYEINYGNINNHGYIIKVDANGDFVQVYNQAVNSTIDGKYIDNDDNNPLNESNFYKDYIFNGIGISGLSTIVIAENTEKELQDSIVNAYGTAVNMGGNATLTASNTIFNGGGLGEFVYDVIYGVNGFNTLNLTDSIVNGDIYMEGDNNTVSILGNSLLNEDIVVSGDGNEVTLGNSIIVNGNLVADVLGSGNVLNLGVAGDEGNLNIFGIVKNFATINIDGKITLFEDVEIMKGGLGFTSGYDNEDYIINLKNESELTFRIDGTETSGDKVIGHALFNIGYVIDGGGTLIVGAAGLGQDTIIGMGSTDIAGLSDEQIQAGSIVHSAEKELNEDWDSASYGDRYDIKITVAKSLEQETDYQNAIWDSIYSTNQVGELEPTTSQEYDKAWADLHVLLDSIYAGNGASRTGRVAMETMGSFNDLVFNNPFTPNPNKWVVYGGTLYNHADVDSSFNSYEGTYSQTLKSKTWGGFARGEYGVDTTSSAGILFGGSRTDLNLTGGSELDGNSVYIGLYGKKRVGDFQLYAGAGYQYIDWSGTRVAANDVQGFKYDQDFNSNAVNTYLGAKYMVELSKDYLIEPKAKLSYTYVNQEDITETGALAVKIDSKSFDYLESELGFDFVANYVNSYGVAKIKLGASWLSALEGADKDSLTARMYTSDSMGTDFGLLVPAADKNKGKVSLSCQFEQEIGFSYYAGLDYIMSKNEKNFAAKLSVGYKF